jgi:hypothetical protein
MGSIGVLEELSWNTLIPASNDAGSYTPPVRTVPGHFRLPHYFQILRSLLRGDPASLDQLKIARQSGEPTSLMIDHDPIILLAIQGAGTGHNP